MALDAQRFVDDLEALRRHFRLERVSLLGHSWGAAIVALYAMRFPERLERFVILGGVPTTRSELVTAFQQLEASRDTTELREMQQWRQARLSDPGDAAACRAYYVLWFRPFFVDSAAARRSKGDFCAGSPEARRNKIQAVDKYTMASLGDYDWRESLRAVRVPALIAHGSMDVLPAASARVWASMLPESRLLLFEGVGHFPYLEVPTEFFAAMDTFLRGVWPEGARAAAAP